MQNVKPGKETKDAWHADPSNWYLGVLYFYNKDKRIFVPKRFSFLGWTVNFANPYSILALLGVIGLGVMIRRFF